MTVMSIVPHTDLIMDAGRGNKLRGHHMSSAPILASMLDPTYAYREFDDFYSFDADDDWAVTPANAGTADVISALGGHLEVDSASGTVDYGVNVQRAVTTWQMAADKDIWFEARINVDAITAIGIDGCQLFLGLSIIDTTIFASGETTASDYVGFVLDATQQGANAGIIQLELNSAGGAEEKTVNGEFQLVEGGWVRLGFYITSNTTLQAYVNGLPVGDALAITSAPTVGLSTSFACLSEGVASADPIMLVDWYECIQLR